jgi:hypothetical protein
VELFPDNLRGVTNEHLVADVGRDGHVLEKVHKMAGGAEGEPRHGLSLLRSCQSERTVEIRVEVF